MNLNKIILLLRFLFHVKIVQTRRSASQTTRSSECSPHKTVTIKKLFSERFFPREHSCLKLLPGVGIERSVGRWAGVSFGLRKYGGCRKVGEPPSINLSRVRAVVCGRAFVFKEQRIHPSILTIRCDVIHYGSSNRFSFSHPNTVIIVAIYLVKIHRNRIRYDSFDTQKKIYTVFCNFIKI